MDSFGPLESGRCQANLHLRGFIRSGGDVVRSELIQKLQAEDLGLTKPEVDRTVNAFFDAMAQQLEAGGRVEIRGFGSFSVRARDARTGRNPRTGDPVVVRAKGALHFKPSREMRTRLNV